MLKVNGLSFSYPQGKGKAIENLSFELEEGNVLVLLGPNGAGKSTLLKLLLGSLKQTQGEIFFKGKSLSWSKASERAKLVSYLPQSTPLPSLTVWETVLSGRAGLFRFKPGPNDEQAAIDALKRVGIEHLSTRMANELSGGERQKVALARALAQGGDLLLFDEPTSNMDILSRRQTLDRKSVV